MKTILLPILILLFIAAGCTDSGVVADFSQHQSAIHNGKEAPDPEYAATIAIAVQVDDTYRVYCSGVLIDKDIVLTAAHCASDDAGIPFTKLYQEGKIFVITGQKANTPDESHRFRVDGLSVHPKHSTAHNEHDLALLWIEREVPEEMALPLPLFKDIEKLKVFEHFHQSIEFSGYGMDENDQDGFRLTAEGTVMNYCKSGNETCAVNDPTGEKLIIPEGSIIHDIEKAGPCIGDSGGPVTVTVDGQKYVLGVTSFGDEYCSVYSVTTTVADHTAWLESTLSPEHDDDCSIHALPVSKRKYPGFWLVMLMFGGAFWVPLRRKAHSSE